MIGDQDLIAARRAGMLPIGVWITDSDDEYSRTTARQWLMRSREPGGVPAAHLRLAAEDIPGALDFRCLSGLDCHIASDRGAARFDRIFDAAVAAGARRVIGVRDGEVRLYPPIEETVDAR